MKPPYISLNACTYCGAGRIGEFEYMCDTCPSTPSLRAEVERLRDELELYKAANSDVRRIAEERNKAISLAKAALKLLSISEGQWDYNDDTLELTRIESELEALNPTDK
jgi:hypothetical protein